VGIVAQPESKFIFANGINIHYLDWGGNGHPLVCIHGATSECHRWDNLARLLFPDFRIISPDLRGHGDTDKPGFGYASIDFCADINAMADAIGLDKFSLLGHSLGVSIVMVYAALHSDRLRSVIPVDMPFEMAPEFRARLIYSIGGRPASFSSLEEAREELKGPLLRDSGLSEEGVQEKLGRLRQNAVGRWEWKAHLAAVTEALSSIPDNLREYTQRITCPALIMRGVLSTVTAHKVAVEQAASIQNSQLVEIENATHDIMWYNIEGMAAALRDFLRDK
jgi:pimeloyl-ACP methyl ester carboxylesterase